MYFYVIQTVFKLFKNHKNQRSQIVLNFILKIYNLLNIKPDRYFLTQNSSVTYNYVFLCYLLSRNQRLKIRSQIVEFHIENLQSAEYQTGSIFFHLKIVQLYIIMYFYIIQTVFKLFKNHKNQRSQIVLNFILKIYNLLKIKPDRYFFTSKQLSYI